jgi:amino acid permease
MKPQKNLRTFLRCWYDNFTGSIFATICLVIFLVLFFHSIDPVGRKDFLLLSAPILLACYFSFQNYTLDRLNFKIAYEWMNLQKLNDNIASREEPKDEEGGDKRSAHIISARAR